MKEIIVYKTLTGKSPYDDWFYKLDKSIQARVEKGLKELRKAIMVIIKN